MKPLLLILSVAFLLLPSPVRADVTIYAAASLSDVIQEVVAGSDIKIHTSFAGTATLARQIEAGAPVDIFIGANTQWMDHLDQSGHIVEQSRQTLAGNAIVAIEPANEGPRRSLRELLSSSPKGRIALAETHSVPAGIYAKQALQRTNYWTGIEGRTILIGQSVRDILFWVERREADLGFVYATDVKRSSGVKVVHRFSEMDHDKVTYSMAILAGRDRPETRKVYDRLLSNTAKSKLKHLGFLVP
jgi:molybdate transport system substrate-binding protein